MLSRTFASKPHAVLTAYLGMLSLVPALFLPAVTIARFGQPTTYTIVSSVLDLVASGNILIAGIIFLFSIVFPILKLGLVLYLASRPRFRNRAKDRSLARFLMTAGKYSMLDVFVIALLIIVFKISGTINAEAGVGLYLFIVSIALSSVANLMLMASWDRASAAPETEAALMTPEGAPEEKATTAGGTVGLIRAALLILAPLLLGLVGAGLYFTASPGTASSVLVQRLPGVDITIVSTPDTPDYAVQLLFENGEVYRSEAKLNTPIGNGIVFDIPDVDMVLLREVSLWDDNSIAVSDLKLSVVPDEIVDRVRIGDARAIEGQRMRFELQGAPGHQLRISIILLAAAALWLAIGVGIWLFGMARRHA